MKNLKSLFSASALTVVLFITGCQGGYNGQLLGELDRPKWNPITPYGMVFIPSGVLHIGPSDQDVNASAQARAKQVSIVGFYMDDTEITNNEYRQFINYVRDSVAHSLLEHKLEGGEEGKDQLDWNQKIEWSGKEKNEQLEEIYLKEDERIWGNLNMCTSGLTTKQPL